MNPPVPPYPFHLQVILGLQYGPKVDIWSLGCILPELLSGYVLFQNESIATMLARITGILGAFPTSVLDRARHAPRYFTRQRGLL